MSYNYNFPEDFKALFAKYAKAMKMEIFLEPIKRCEIKHRDVGYAYYAGICGYWDFHAIDVDIFGAETDLEIIEDNKPNFVQVFNRALDPETTGLVSREFLFLPHDKPTINLPEKPDPTLETLRPEITALIEEGKPTLALDRLHTFTTKFLRTICDDSQIPIKKSNGDYLPLHSVMGRLCNHYEENNLIESEFSLRALKSSISLLEAFNDIRNNKSYAHDNPVLNKVESEFVVEIVSSVLNLLNAVKPEPPTWS
ncbi:abortive infection family protein [Allobaculum mucilyticum]|uniref:abortive infection family protein n=1 Tax=Allobaculum mucilyticum TaxID=2834459 RepID=UPI001E2C0F8A|nr:abortive infection family protein [Allobaculum mucilyticum]UNT96723.1 abortive infection family protein [Allobaculum mucilyticum]